MECGVTRCWRLTTRSGATWCITSIGSPFPVKLIFFFSSVVHLSLVSAVVWSPGQKPPSLDSEMKEREMERAQDRRQEEELKSMPAKWTPGGSSGGGDAARREFRPVKLDTMSTPPRVRKASNVSRVCLLVYIIYYICCVPCDWVHKKIFSKALRRRNYVYDK